MAVYWKAVQNRVRTAKGRHVGVREAAEEALPSATVHHRFSVNSVGALRNI